METAEVKTKKRIRHCYPRQEVYHRWVHSPELVYSAGDSYKCFGIGDYFCTGTVNSKYTLEKFHDFEYSNLQNCIAIINREKKEIIIYTDYKYHSYDLFRAVPNDYTIFYTDDKINSLDILNNKEELYKRHAKHLVSNFIGRYSAYYQVLDNKAKTLHWNIDADLENEDSKPNEIIGPNDFISKQTIINFAKKYKLGKYKWYNKSLGSTKVYNGWNNSTEIVYPSLRKIINNKIFTEEQLIYLRRKYFYTIYCYGQGIPFIDVIKYWHKAFTANEIKTYLRKRHISDNWSFLEGIDTWNNWIIKIINASREYKRRYEEESYIKANQNYKKAQEELNKLKDDSWNVNDWREGKRLPKISVEYRDYCKGEWVTRTLSLDNRYRFPNVQFKLVNDKILTSRNVTIKYEEGVRLFRIFRNTFRNRGNCTIFNFDSYFDKVDIYNLKRIEYKSKCADIGFNKGLGYNTWLIQVGCHAIWLDDMLDFIHYYNKEEDFGITKETTFKDFDI